MKARDIFLVGLLTGVVLTAAAAIGLTFVRAPATPPSAAPAATPHESALANSAAPAPTGSGEAPVATAAAESVDAGAAAGDADKAALKLDVADPSHVDAADLYPRAKALAMKIEKRARLSRINLPAISDDGTVDLNKDKPIEYRFEYDYVEPHLPVGKNVFKGRLVVAASSSGLKVTQVPARAEEKFPDHRIADPRCTMKKAWSAVAATAVPEASLARVGYEFDERARGGVWHFAFGKGGSGDRVVDGGSCALSSATPASPAQAEQGRK